MKLNTKKDIEQYILSHMPRDQENNINIPDYMIGCDIALSWMALSLLLVERGERSVDTRDTLFNMVVGLPNLRFYSLYGGHLIPLYMSALASTENHVMVFLKPALVFVRHKCRNGSYDEYSTDVELFAKNDSTH